MPDDSFSLADLARLADVTPRTIRYYVAQGLLPSPDAAGPATRYGDGHLARLRLIRRLQRDHLPLAEIRARLERMGDEDVQAALDALGPGAPAPSQDPGDTLAYVRSLMRSTGVSPSSHGTPAVSEPHPQALRKVALDMPKPASGPSEHRAAAPPPPGGPILSSLAEPPPSSPVPTERGGPGIDRTQVASRSTWERLVITPDIEIHVRRPLDRFANKQVERLERIARELFEEEP